MALPRWPYSARLARTLKDARRIAKNAGHPQIEGERAWRGAAAFREAAEKKRASRWRPSPRPSQFEEYRARPRAADLAAQAPNEYGNILATNGVRGGRFISRRWQSMIVRLGIPVRLCCIGFTRSPGYGSAPILALLLVGDEVPRWQEQWRRTQPAREKSRIRRAADAVRRETELDGLASSLGVRRDSRAFAWYLDGDIDAAECRRIGRITAARHEQTDYDDLRAAGWDRDEAREQIQDQMRSALG